MVRDNANGKFGYYAMTMLTETVVLASASPRRRLLLEQLGIHCRVVPAQIDEKVLPGEQPDVFVQRMAKEKADAVWGQQTENVSEPVLGADTVVVLDNHVLGKPADKSHGIEMLMALSGRTHSVLTAVALRTQKGEAEIALSASHVTFRVINREECERYWSTGEPADKAGGYAIQGKGAIFVANLHGSYSGVMGLPLFETAHLLTEVGVTVLPSEVM